MELALLSGVVCFNIGFAIGVVYGWRKRSQKPDPRGLI